MRRQCGFRYHLLANTSKSLLLDMYHFLTGDKTSGTISPGVQERLKIMIDSQDPDITFDLRHLNSGRPEHFEEFWSAGRGLINENALKAVDSRRHGLICHMALAVSVRDLRDTVLAKHPGIAAPSLEWLRLQFCPQNEFKKSALLYTGRLGIKFMVQS